MRSSVRCPLSTTATVGILVAALLSPAALVAQAKALLPSGTGFSVSASASMARTTSSGSGLDGNATKPGGQVEVAYGASPRLSLLAAFRPIVATAGTQNYSVNGLELGLRYLGKAGTTLRPFVEGGFGVRTLRYEISSDAFTSTNVGPWASVGVMRLAASHWSVEAAGTWTKSPFDNWKRNDQAVVAQAVQWSGVGARVGLRYWVRAR
jgi:hypothetical protein